jgi:hypothetical protein
MGDYKVLFAEGTVYVFARTLGTEELIVAVNIGTAPVEVSFEPADLKSQPSQTLYGNGEVSWTTEGESAQLALSLAPRTGCILGSAA